MKTLELKEAGFTLVEMLVSLFAFLVISVSLFSLYLSLVHSAITAKQIAVASSLATNQMEYLKSLPYDNLAVSGGSIYSTNPLPASFTKKLDGVTYTIRTSISYIDDAYDGCGSYPNQTLKQTYCRNYPPPSGAPSTDTNPADYKIADVSVVNKAGSQLASVDTEISARVAETSSATGALFVSVLDQNGNPLSGATVTVVNSTVSPAINLSDGTDENGVAIFYDLPPDSGTDYQITATDSSYSTLNTILASGSLQPTYPNQKILTQASSYVTLTLKQQGPNSLVIETTDTSGNPLASVKVYIKGGYKKYTTTSDTSYYYDNMSPNDTRPTTDSNGLASLSNLVPGSYIFCGDSGATNCKIGATTYYLAAALPYGGVNPFNPIAVPTYDANNPPSTTYAYGGNNYYQKVRLVLTTSSSFPRINTVTPYDASLSGGSIGSFGFNVTGTNLPCSSTASSCSTSVKFTEGSSTYTASCTGSSAGTSLNCTVNLTGSSQGNTQMVVTVGANTLTMPVAPPLGGLIVTP